MLGCRSYTIEPLLALKLGVPIRVPALVVPPVLVNVTVAFPIAPVDVQLIVYLYLPRFIVGIPTLIAGFNVDILPIIKYY